MTGSVDASQPIAGLYEQLITLRLETQLTTLSANGDWHAIDDEVGPESSPGSSHVMSPTP